MLFCKVNAICKIKYLKIIIKQMYLQKNIKYVIINMARRISMILLIISILVAIVMFVYTFARMIKNNYQDFVFALILEFVGITIAFFEILLARQPSSFEFILIYIFSIVFPIFMIILETKKMHIAEIKLLFKKSYIGKETILQVIKKYPDSYIAHKKMAEYYENKAENEKAEDEYRKLIELNPDEYANYCKLAQIFESNGKSDEAVQTLHQLLKIRPDYTTGSLMLGNILYNNEKFKEAILVYNSALKYNPKEYMIYYQMGMTYTRVNDFNSAKECYKKAATINSIQDVSNLSVGLIYLLFEEYEQAEEYFYRTLDCDDDMIIANSYYYLAKIRLIQNNKNQAIQYANLAIEFNPDISRRMENDDVFIPILKDLSMKPSKRITTKLNEKEIKTMEHLGRTFNVVERLTNNSAIRGDNRDKDVGFEIEK